MDKLEGKIACVTGAASGIGAATARSISTEAKRDTRAGLIAANTQ